MIISITGKPGSGKTTLGKMLAEKLGYRHYYIGGLRRRMALDRGMTLEELNALGEQESWTDQEVDAYQKKIAEHEDNFVIEGRTSYFFIPHSLKIYVDVSPEEGARRVFQELQNAHNTRNEGNKLTSIQSVEKSHEQRVRSDATRYKKYYGIDVSDLSHYDYVLETTKMTIPEAFEALSTYVTHALASKKQAK